MVQVIQLWADGHLSIADAVAAARIHVLPGKRFYMESQRVPRRTRGVVEPLGYSIESVNWDLSVRGLNAYFGGVHAVALENGVWRGAADPRRDGAVGYAKN